jgi:hypothetical protein
MGGTGMAGLESVVEVRRWWEYCDGCRMGEVI